MSRDTTGSHPGSPGAGASWGREATLQLAWTTWLFLLATPFIVLPFALHMTPGTGGSGPKPRMADQWFLIVMVYLLVALPVALLVRGYLFKGFWRGRGVPPRTYYVGMLIPWAVVMVAGLVAELVCVVSGTVVPNILPALLALFIYLMLWPSGTAMEPRARGGNPDLDQEPA